MQVTPRLYIFTLILHMALFTQVLHMGYCTKDYTYICAILHRITQVLHMDYCTKDYTYIYAILHMDYTSGYCTENYTYNIYANITQVLRTAYTSYIVFVDIVTQAEEPH